MNYKYLLIFIFSFLCSRGPLLAQSTATKDKLEAIKIGFLTERLDLTPTQAAGFWPMYNEYSSKRKDIKTKINALGIEKQLEQLTEDQISQDIKMLYAYKEAELQLEKEYLSKFTKYISQRQAAKLYKAEREFVKMLLKKLEEK